MKKFRLTLIALALFAFGSTMVSCEKNQDVKPKIEKIENLGVYDVDELSRTNTLEPKKKRKKR